MPHELIEFATSSNGDRWLLGPAEGDNRAFVEHRANEPSGGVITRTSVTAFLAGKPTGPQHDALLQLLQSNREPTQPQSLAAGAGSLEGR